MLASPHLSVALVLTAIAHDVSATWATWSVELHNLNEQVYCEE